MGETSQARVRRAAGWVLLAVVLAALVHVLYRRQSGPHSLQAGLNLQFAQRPSLALALEKYPKLRPPLYPLLLRGWVQAFDTPDGLDELLGLLSLPLLALAGRRLGLRTAQLVALLVLWASSHFVYVNLYQWTAEALVVPLGLALLLALSSDVQAPRARTAIAVALLTAALLLCRYFSLFYVAPVASVALLAAALPWRARLRRAVAVIAVASVPVLFWMAAAYRETGYWTGVARTAPRPAAEQVHWREMTTFDSNLLLLGRTVAIDFLSDHRAAVLSAVTQPWEPSPIEWLLLAVAGIGGAVLVQHVARRGLPRDPALLLCAGLLGTYLVALVVVWTTGNNDPLHTRFLFPAYPFLLLLVFAAFARLEHRAERIPLVVLWALVIGVQLPRAWVAEPVPVRFDSMSPLEAAQEEEPAPVDEDPHARRERARARRHREGRGRHHTPASPSP